VVRLRIDTTGAYEGELRSAQRRGWRFTVRHVGIELVHDRDGGLVIDVPESRDNAPRTGPEKRPRESDEAFAGVEPLASAPARGDRDQVRLQRVFGDLARIQFV